MSDDLILVGRVAGAFGVKGEVRITSLHGRAAGAGGLQDPAA